MGFDLGPTVITAVITGAITAVPGGCDSSRLGLRVPIWLAEAARAADFKRGLKTAIAGWSPAHSLVKEIIIAGPPRGFLAFGRLYVAFACLLLRYTIRGRHPPLVRLAILSEPKLAIARNPSQKTAAVTASITS